MRGSADGDGAAIGIGAWDGADGFTACLVEKQFAHPDQFVAYVGLDLRVHQSGRRTGQFGLSKQGDADLHRLLSIAALAASQAHQDTTFADRYAREQDKGLAKTQALNAVARKLAKVAWSLVTHRSTYDPTRVDFQTSYVQQVDTKAENLRSAQNDNRS